MQRISTHICIVVISLALSLTVTLTATQLSEAFALTGGEQAKPVLSGGGVVTNRAGKGDRVALDTTTKPLDMRCVSHARTTTCSAEAPAKTLASLN